jgi:periplasmic protein TonB
MVSGTAGLAATDTAESSNVIPFARRPSSESPWAVLEVDAQSRPAPRVTPRRAVIGPSAFLICSLGIHAAALAVFNRPPPPLPSVGTVAMSLEIVVGTNTTAGLEKAPTESESMVTSTASVPDASSVPTPPEITRDEARSQEPQAAAETQTSDAPLPVVRAADLPSAVESASKSSILAEPVEASPGKTSEIVVRLEPSHAPPPATTRREPERTHVRPERERNATEQPVSPRQRESKNQSGGRQQAKRETRTASVAATASSGVGRGRSDAEANCPGLVNAHLRRYQQWDSQERREQGNTKVTFALDGAGRVTSARLSSSSGVASVDQESLATVRRASPFVLPSGCLGMSYTVPLIFSVR